MINSFLLNEAVDLDDFVMFKLGMSELVAIDRMLEDSFIKHESIWNLEIMPSLYSNYGQVEQAIVKFIEQLTPSESYIDNEVTIDALYPEDANCFLGIDFSNTTIAISKQIINQDTFDKFKHDNLWDITFRNLWSKRVELFPNLILCGQVEQQISLIGNSSQFNQIVTRLKTLDQAVEKWTQGDFSYRNINENYSLRISPESEQTMNKFGNERKFSLPSGGTKIFELHIKTGDFRFHFYTDNETKEVYVGYIGPHLNIVSN